MSVYEVPDTLDVVRVKLEREDRAGARDFAVRVAIDVEGPSAQAIKSKVVWGVEETDAAYNALRIALAVLESSDFARTHRLRVAPGSKSLEQIIREASESIAD